MSAASIRTRASSATPFSKRHASAQAASAQSRVRTHGRQRSPHSDRRRFRKTSGGPWQACCSGGSVAVVNSNDGAAALSLPRLLLDGGLICRNDLAVAEQHATRDRVPLVEAIV